MRRHTEYSPGKLDRSLNNLKPNKTRDHKGCITQVRRLFSCLKRQMSKGNTLYILTTRVRTRKGVKKVPDSWGKGTELKTYFHRNTVKNKKEAQYIAHTIAKVSVARKNMVVVGCNVNDMSTHVSIRNFNRITRRKIITRFGSRFTNLNQLFVFCVSKSLYAVNMCDKSLYAVNNV